MPQTGNLTANINFKLRLTWILSNLPWNKEAYLKWSFLAKNLGPFSAIFPNILSIALYISRRASKLRFFGTCILLPRSPIPNFSIEISESRHKSSTLPVKPVSRHQEIQCTECKNFFCSTWQHIFSWTVSSFFLERYRQPKGIFTNKQQYVWFLIYIHIIFICGIIYVLLSSGSIPVV